MKTSSHHLLHNGRIMDSKKIAGFYLADITYAPRAKVPRHSHQYAWQNIEVKPPYLYFVLPGEVHSNDFGDLNVRCFLIEAEGYTLTRRNRLSIIKVC
jgi:hypothetical protein